MACTMKIELEHSNMAFNDRTNLLSYRESTQNIDLSAILERKNNVALDHLSSMPSFDKALDKTGGSSARQNINQSKS